MKSSTTLATIALLLGAAHAGAAPTELTRNVMQQDGWVGWQVPMTDSVGMACCFAWQRGNVVRNACDLDDRNLNVSTNDEGPGPTPADTLSVYVHVAGGRIDRTRAFNTSCKVRNADQVRRIDPVASTDSIALLNASAATAADELADAQISAIAMHADPAATATLEKLADASHSREVREHALFWLAQARGAEGARIVERVATSDADSELREKAVFALSEAHGFDGYASIQRISRQDKSEHVREQALFWMAQMGDARARGDIVAAIGSETSDSVREQAVFALSQLKEGEAENALIALIRGNYPRKVKEQALFWLGQSGSPQALDFLDEVLTRHVGKATES